MACNCGKQKNRFEVVQNGKVVFRHASATAADAVARRYPGSVVRDTQAAT